jgi:glucokinase
MTKVLAIDVGGTKLVYAIINENGEFLTEVKRTSTPKEINELKNTFKRIIEENENNIDVVAFATAGAVNLDNTRVDSSTPNMPDGYNKMDFSKLSSKPVYVENDANAAAWAEYKVGAAMGEDNNITITLGTGVGGGFIVDGKLVRGKSGRGGEVGSMKINGRGRICTCHRENCFESYASGTGLKITAEEVAQNANVFKDSIYKDKSPEEITTYDIIAGLKQNDEYSKMVFNIWKNDLITGLINITNIFDTETIVISGGLGEFINTKEIEEAVNSEIVVSPVKIKLAKAGNYAGMIGAALLASNKYFTNK